MENLKPGHVEEKKKNPFYEEEFKSGKICISKEHPNINSQINRQNASNLPIEEI